MITNAPIRLSREELDSIFAAFGQKRVLVIGDVMLDAYWWGRVDRISPEAPVPIVNVQRREYRLGGAANVALNLASLGAQAVICSVIGRDMDGEVFLRMLSDASISQEGVVFSETRPTTVKTRVLGNRNQLLRIDSEDDRNISADESLKLSERILALLPEADLVIFEDYDKGVITDELINAVTEAARAANIPVAVDPKKRNFLSYRHATLFKPNLRELSEGLKLDLDGQSGLEEIENAAAALVSRLQAEQALITLSERGVLITDGKKSRLVPAHIRNIYDVSGAGDTVISVAALSMLTANNKPEIWAALANLAGGLVCEKVGVVPIEREELYQEAVREFCE